MNPIKRLAARIIRSEIRHLLMASSRAHQAEVGPWHGTLGVGKDWRPKDYGEYYAKSVPVYAAIKTRADALARVPWVFHREDSRGARAILPPGHPAALMLEQPNPWMSGADLRIATETFLCLYGVAFWGLEPGEEGRPEVWPLRPDRMTVLPGTRRRGPHIAGFKYEAPFGTIVYQPDEVTMFSFFNPLESQRSGLSPIAPLRLTSDMGLDAISFNRNTLRNGGIPDLVFLAMEGFTQEQVDDFYRRWDQRFGGPSNAHRPAIVNDVQDVKELAFSHREMEWLMGLKWNVQDTSRVYGVPATMLGELEFATLANMEALERIFWRNTMMPEAQTIQETVNRMLQALGFLDIHMEFDFSGIQALAEGEEQRLKRELEYLDRGVMTINEVRRSREMEDVPWGNEPRFREPRPNQPQPNASVDPLQTLVNGNGHHA